MHRFRSRRSWVPDMGMFRDFGMIAHAKPGPEREAAFKRLGMRDPNPVSRAPKKKLPARTGGPGPTMLTGGQGVTGQAATDRKSLLGS